MTISNIIDTAKTTASITGKSTACGAVIVTKDSCTAKVSEAAWRDNIYIDRGVYGVYLDEVINVTTALEYDTISKKYYIETERLENFVDDSQPVYIINTDEYVIMDVETGNYIHRHIIIK